MKSISYELPQPEIDLEKRLREAEGRLAKRIYDLEKWRAQKEGRTLPPPPNLPPVLPPLTKAPGAALARQKALSRVLDEMYFKVDLDAGNTVFEGGAAATQNTHLWTMRFPDVVGAAAASRTTGARELWVGTTPVVELTYTCPFAGVATFGITARLLYFGPGINMNILGAGSFASVTFTVPGPAAANDILTARCRFPSRFLASPYGGVRFLLVRNLSTNDANANDLDIILARFVMEETA